MNDIVSVGASLKLVTVDAAAREFGTTPDAMRDILRGWGVPVLGVGGHEFLSTYELERCLIERTITLPPNTTTSEFMQWLNSYHGTAHQRAILESLRHARPLWKRAAKRAKSSGHPTFPRS